MDDARREQVRARVEQLVRDGMPHPLAVAVAHGVLDLSDALERMARRQRVDRMMAEHDLSRALATQIALGHASLDDVLTRRRLEQLRATDWHRSVLDPGGGPLVLLMHGDKRLTARVAESAPYFVRLQPVDERGNAQGDPVDVHKLQLKIAYPVAAWKEFRKVLKRDKDLQANPLAPVPRPQDRFGCSDKRLFKLAERKVEVSATTLEGEVLRGTVAWFSRFEIGLAIKGGSVITVFRHALHALG